MDNIELVQKLSPQQVGLLLVVRLMDIVEKFAGVNVKKEELELKKLEATLAFEIRKAEASAKKEEAEAKKEEFEAQREEARVKEAQAKAREAEAEALEAEKRAQKK